MFYSEVVTIVEQLIDTCNNITTLKALPQFCNAHTPKLLVKARMVFTSFFFSKNWSLLVKLDKRGKTQYFSTMNVHRCISSPKFSNIAFVVNMSPLKLRICRLTYILTVHKYSKLKKLREGILFSSPMIHEVFR